MLEVVRWAAERTCVSIDTTSPEVAAACLDAGAAAVNDVSLLADPELASVAAGSGAALILSHARAPQANMSGFGGWPLSAYDDIVRRRARRLGARGARSRARAACLASRS